MDKLRVPSEGPDLAPVCGRYRQNLKRAVVQRLFVAMSSFLQGNSINWCGACVREWISSWPRITLSTVFSGGE